MSQQTDTKVNIKKTVKEKFKIKLPKNYRIVLLNNDITSFEAVVDVLKAIFSKNSTEAKAIMMHAHMNGRALVEAPVTKEIGEAKIKQAEDYCQKREIEADQFMGRPNYYTYLKFEVEED